LKWRNALKFSEKNINCSTWTRTEDAQYIFAGKITHLKLKTFYRSSFEFQTRNYVTCFSHICNHPHGQENYTQKKIHKYGFNNGLRIYH